MTKKKFPTLYRTKEFQTSFVVNQWPNESFDNVSLYDWEESEEHPDSVSELSTTPLITQTHDCWQRHTDEVESKAVGTPYHNKTCLIAKRTKDLINFLTQLMLLIGRNLSPLWHDSIFSSQHVANRFVIQLSIHTNNHWNSTQPQSKNR